MTTTHDVTPAHAQLDRNGASHSFHDLDDYDADKHGHYLEGACVVYLRRNSANTAWLIDGPTTDGYGLDTSHPEDDLVFDTDECPCGHTPRENEAKHVAAVDAVQSLPNADELVHLLADALGYELRKIDGPVCRSCGRTEPQDDSCADDLYGRHDMPAA